MPMEVIAIAVRNLTPQLIGLHGLQPSLEPAAVDGNCWANTGREVLLLENRGQQQLTATILSQTPCNQGFVHDLPIALLSGARVAVGAFARARWNDQAGRVQVRYSDVPSLYVAVISLGNLERLQSQQPRQWTWFFSTYQVVVVDNPWQS